MLALRRLIALIGTAAALILGWTFIKEPDLISSMELCAAITLAAFLVVPEDFLTYSMQPRPDLDDGLASGPAAAWPIYGAMVAVAGAVSLTIVFMAVHIQYTRAFADLDGLQLLVVLSRDVGGLWTVTEFVVLKQVPRIMQLLLRKPWRPRTFTVTVSTA